MSIACVPTPHVPRGVVADISAFNRVLVATDFSDGANDAIPCAFSAVARDGTVCLLHVAKLKATNQKGDLEAQLRALIPAAAVKLGVKVEVRVVDGDDAAKAICEVADRFGADLVCLGTNGRSALATMVMGSVARTVIGRVSRPVLVVPPLASRAM